MTTMIELLRRLFPAPLFGAGVHTVRSIRQVRQAFGYFFHPKGWLSGKRLAEYRDKHWGERCVIIGNGPSLRCTNMELLRDEVTFGLNRIYLMFDDTGFCTSYYVSVNELVIEQCAKDISALSMPKFLSWQAGASNVSMDNHTVFLNTSLPPGFSQNALYGVWEGATVTFVAMQLAYHMGFHEVILVGVDHSFDTKGPPHETVTSTGEDVDHFSPSYFGEGFRWQLPDLEVSTLAYILAKRQFEQDGREIVDATVDGKLDVFRKSRLEDLLL